MKRPEKKDIKRWMVYHEFDKGYNQACDNWEEWLPSDKELLEFLTQAHMKGYHSCCNRDPSYYEARVQCETLLIAIHKRLRGKQ